MHGLRDALDAVPAVAVLRGLDSDAAVAVGSAAAEAGLRAVEVTLDSPGALKAIASLAAGVPEGVVVGAGTVVRRGDVEAAVAAGASFLVAPHLDLEVLAVASAAGVPMVPGVATPSELHAAVGAGVEMVKLFPATALGTDYLRALRGPYPHTPIIVTGGVSVGDAAAWMSAGATAVGVGTSALGRVPSQVADRVSALVAAVLTS